MVNALLELRKQYKDENNDAMQSTVKLVGNGIFGKFAQQTNALIPEAIHDSILQDVRINNSTHSDVIQSMITNPVMANWITGFIRSVVAISAAENKAIMAVTDSLLVPGKWTPSAKIKSPYGHLQKALNSTEWT